jgi:hypothetical protein
MKRAWQILVVLLSLGTILPTSAADNKCNCKVFPYKPDPPCFAQCTALLLSSNSKSNLEKFLGISSTLAGKISAHATASTQAGGFLSDLTAVEKQELSLHLQNLNQAKVDELSRSFTPQDLKDQKVTKQYEMWASKDLPRAPNDKLDKLNQGTSERL